MAYTGFTAASRPQKKKRSPFPALTILLSATLLAGGFLAGRSWTSAPVSNVHAFTAPVQASAKPDTGDWKLLLVNGSHPLPDGFAEPELTKLRNGQHIDSRVYPALQKMMDAAREEGLKPLICSSFRPAEKQAALYEKKVRSYLAEGYGRQAAEEQAAQWVARPGTSEHQSGLAVDIVAEDYQLLDEAQQHTAVQKWLMAHCAEYGFILRYPTDKSELTGVGFEPWHYRYVGREAAQEIMEKGICLEEYLGAS